MLLWLPASWNNLDLIKLVPVHDIVHPAEPESRNTFIVNIPILYTVYVRMCAFDEYNIHAYVKIYLHVVSEYHLIIKSVF